MSKITKEDVLNNIEEVKKYIQEAEQKTKEKNKVVIEIKNRFTGEVKFASEKSTIKEAIQDNKANLYGADLSGADLRKAELQNAKFYGKGGATKIKKSQVDDFFKALGIIVE